MKFWKSLSNLMEETLPDWRDKFLSYKDLKKQLKLIYPKEGDKPLNKRPRLDDDQMDSGKVEKEVIDFVRVLEDEMEKFNSFIVEKEEDYVIKWKILKKYDKRTGALVRMPFIQRIMQQPFYTTHVLNKLIKECETMLDHIFSRKEPSVSPQITDEISGLDTKPSTESSASSLRVPSELPEIEYMESMYVKLTLSALRVLKDVRSGSSTVSVYSLPPLQINTQEGDWKKVNVLEQAAK
ncbi:SPX domain-containing protein 1-like [Populus alba x Populus x berolinensis]|nr:SPX domain-containing protein 1-like [Populus alba x Populus x berolinensis]